jgi:prevent-host-death family protein
LIYNLDRLDSSLRLLLILSHNRRQIMSHAWQLQEAKNKFSNLVERAHKEGPQIVTKHGKESVVVLSVEDFKKLIRPKTNLYKFLQESPLAGLDLDIARDKKPPRDVSLS